MDRISIPFNKSRREQIKVFREVLRFRFLMELSCFIDGIYTISLTRILCILASQLQLFPEVAKLQFDLESATFSEKLQKLQSCILASKCNFFLKSCKSCKSCSFEVKKAKKVAPVPPFKTSPETVKEHRRNP